MKTILEQIPRKEGSSFRILEDPKLHDFYYWHFHPEIELVYIEGVDGERHIGTHSSKYKNGDLAMIGSFIPHLNFDYGVKGIYYKMVLQIDQHFLSPHAYALPEFKHIRTLLADANHGLIFNERLRLQVGRMMKRLPQLKDLEQLQYVLTILDLLAREGAYVKLHKLPYQNAFYKKQQEKFRTVIDFVEANYDRKIKISEIASICNYSEAAFCRYFKKMTKLNFTNFVNNYRIDIAKRMLKEGANISESCYATGFESLSYFNKTFKKITGVNPSKFKA